MYKIVSMIEERGREKTTQTTSEEWWSGGIQERGQLWVESSFMMIVS